MVRGLDIFRSHFAKYTEQYILIGGTACDLAFDSAGIEFRSTQDLDIVLCVEALDKNFVEAFWKFIRIGKYGEAQQSKVDFRHYRFIKPGDNNFPKMIELFSCAPDILKIPDDIRIIPIPTDENLSSLSAILLDDDYYRFIKSGRYITEDGLSIIKQEYLIPLKLYAWLDLIERKNRGEKVDSKDIKKHRNDVFRLFQLLKPADNVVLEGNVYKYTKRGLNQLLLEKSINLKALGLGKLTIEEVFEELKKIYGI